jgi:hypothetical protein
MITTFAFDLISFANSFAGILGTSGCEIITRTPAFWPGPELLLRAEAAVLAATIIAMIPMATAFVIKECIPLSFNPAHSAHTWNNPQILFFKGTG